MTRSPAWLAIVLLLAGCEHASRSPPTTHEPVPVPPVVRPAPSGPYQVGDIVEQYRHFDVDHFLPGPDADKAGTRWKVLEITDAHVRLVLVDGRYAWGFDGEEYKEPGYQTDFESSNNYRQKFPTRKPNAQILEEWGRAK